MDGNLVGRGGAESRHAVFLERAREPVLQRERQLTHFVEVHGATTGQLQRSGATRGVAVRRVGAEELRLQYRRRNRRTIDGDERIAGACARVVNAAGEQVLAGSGFAEQHQRAHRGSGDAVSRLNRVAHHGAAGDDRREFETGIAGADGAPGRGRCHRVHPKKSP
jgi:hypothetical protein